MKEETKKYVKLAATVFLLYLCMYYWKSLTGVMHVAFRAATPLLIGVAIAYVVNILMSFYEKHYFPKSENPKVRKSARPVCMFAALLSINLILVFVIGMIVPRLGACVQLLFAEVPKAMKGLIDLLAKSGLFSEESLRSFRDINWNSTLSGILDAMKNGLGNTMNAALDAVTSVVSTAANVLIGEFFAIYMLLGKERLLGQSRKVLARYLRPSWNEKLYYVLDIANGCFSRYIVGQCTEAVILGALCTTGMLIFGFPYAGMTGVLIGVTALIPVAGAYIGGVVGFLLIFSVSPMKGVLFVVYLVLLQQFEDKLIYPRVVGASIGLPGLWVMATITIGGGMFGIMGMLVGVPVAATVYKLVGNDVRRNELSKEQSV